MKRMRSSPSSLLRQNQRTKLSSNRSTSISLIPSLHPQSRSSFRPLRPSRPSLKPMPSSPPSPRLNQWSNSVVEPEHHHISYSEFLLPEPEFIPTAQAEPAPIEAEAFEPTASPRLNQRHEPVVELEAPAYLFTPSSYSRSQSSFLTAEAEPAQDAYAGRAQLRRA